MLKGYERARRQLQALSMPPAQRRKLFLNAAKAVKKDSKKRIQNESDLKGRKWAPRKDKRRKKMLRGIKRLMVHKATNKEGQVTFNNLLVGSIAKAHQEGIAQVVSASTLRGSKASANKGKPATRKQARALREAGYKAPRSAQGGQRKGYKKPTVKWITENLTLGQAGSVLKILKNEGDKSSWEIKRPKRPFLGATPAEVADLLDDITEQMLGNIKAA